MTSFVKGIVRDQANRVLKMIQTLNGHAVDEGLNTQFLAKTMQMLHELQDDINFLLDSGDLDIEELISSNIIRYNTFHERLIMIELFRYLVILNYGPAERYFKKKVERIYKEINCLQKPPIITTISNSQSYYWALPSYDVIAVPNGEERNLLNLPDLYHEMGHLIYNQYENYLKGDIEDSINRYYQDEIANVHLEQRAPELVNFYREKNSRWINGWVMEFTCDFIATYLVGPAYAWTNLKITTLSSGKDRVYTESVSHPSDESRMKGIFFLLGEEGFADELTNMEKSWNEFLKYTNNPVPPNYADIFPIQLLQELVRNVINGCRAIGLHSYQEQMKKNDMPISKVLNEAWQMALTDHHGFKIWEENSIKAIEESL